MLSDTKMEHDVIGGERDGLAGKGINMFLIADVASAILLGKGNLSFLRDGAWCHALFRRRQRSIDTTTTNDIGRIDW